MFLSSQKDVSYYYSAFNRQIPPIYQVKALELMSNLLNIILLYYKSVKELKMSRAEIVISKTVLLLSII